MLRQRHPHASMTDRSRKLRELRRLWWRLAGPRGQLLCLGLISAAVLTLCSPTAATLTALLAMVYYGTLLMSIGPTHSHEKLRRLFGAAPRHTSRTGPERGADANGRTGDRAEHQALPLQPSLDAREQKSFEDIVRGLGLD